MKIHLNKRCFLTMVITLTLFSTNINYFHNTNNNNNNNNNINYNTINLQSITQISNLNMIMQSCNHKKQYK